MIYEYKCPTCQLTSEVDRSIHAEASNPFCSCGEMMNRVWLLLLVEKSNDQQF